MEQVTIDLKFVWESMLINYLDSIGVFFLHIKRDVLSYENWAELRKWKISILVASSNSEGLKN